MNMPEVPEGPEVVTPRQFFWTRDRMIFTITSISINLNRRKVNALGLSALSAQTRTWYLLCSMITLAMRNRQEV